MGINWSLVNSGLTSSSFQALAIDPKTTTTLYAGTDGKGIFKSMDGGGNFFATNNGLTNRNVKALVLILISQPHYTPEQKEVEYSRAITEAKRGFAINTGLTNLSVHALAIRS